MKDTRLTFVNLAGMYNALTSGWKGMKGGSATRQGGEWLFQDGELKWCHRMQNSQDHAEVEELKEVLAKTW